MSIIPHACIQERQIHATGLVRISEIPVYEGLGKQGFYFFNLIHSHQAKLETFRDVLRVLTMVLDRSITIVQ